ncbi:hypothetical protein [Streptacidiphilus sp. PB12-B1b]|uniref:hypothetical protein n=1 Tax=Streptacidiphilus sp. PB12-B1b TaxID=2705012 RepID=UPI00351A44A3
MCRSEAGELRTDATAKQKSLPGLLMRHSGPRELGEVHALPDVMCRGPEEHRLAIEEHGRVALLHPVDELVRDIVDSSQMGCQPWRLPTSIRSSATRSGSASSGGSTVQLMALNKKVSVITASGY